MLGSVAAAINIGFSVLRSYGIPLILESGLHIKYATSVFAISPMMAFLLQGFLGTISDQCDCWWGRRRPFIVTFSVSAAIGFFFAPIAFYLSNISKALVVATVSACLVIGDFSIGVLQLPSRAYLLDVLSPSQSVRGNFFFSALYGVGSAFGAFLGGINWSWITRQSLTIPHQGLLVYGLTAISIIVCMFLTICSVKEKPYMSDTVGPERLDINEAMYYDEFEIETNDCSCLSCSRCFKAFFDPFVDIYKFIRKMSYHMWLLWIMSFVSFFALIFFNSYLTLFVGTVVYNGDPDAPKNSDSYRRYVEGVHIGSWVLALAAIGNFVFSLLLSYITKFIDIKTIYLVVTTLYTIGSCFLIYFHQLPLVFAVGFIFGLFYGLTLTVPFTLIPIYKVSYSYLLQYKLYNHMNITHYLIWFKLL